MKIRKVLSIVMVLVMLVSIIAGCAKKDTPEETGKDTKPEASQSQEETQEDTEEGTRVITDVFGREVEIPLNIETVASMGSATRFLVYAQATDKIVGVSDVELKVDVSRPYNYVCYDDIKDCAPLASLMEDANSYAEVLVELDPDIIFYSTSQPSGLDTLAQKTGLPIVGLHAENFFDQSFYDTMDLVGDIMGKTERTDALNAAFKGWTEDLKTRAAKVPDEEKPTVYAGAVSWAGRHGVEGTYGQYPPFVAVGANNVVDETGAPAYVEIDKEQIAAWDPDFLFLTISSMDIVNEDYAVNPAFYDSLSAVENGKVYTQIPFNAYSTNQELAVLDAYFVGSVVFPEQFADIDFDKLADEVCTTVLGQPYMDVLEENGFYFGTVTIGE